MGKLKHPQRTAGFTSHETEIALALIGIVVALVLPMVLGAMRIKQTFWIFGGVWLAVFGLWFAYIEIMNWWDERKRRRGREDEESGGGAEE